MIATERFSSLDETIRAIRHEYEMENQTLKDALTAAQIEKEIAQTKMTDALRERDVYLRLATKLVTQFATVEQVFADAKRIAIEHAMLEAKEGQPKEPAQSESPANPTSSFDPSQPLTPSDQAQIEEALKSGGGQ